MDFKTWYREVVDPADEYLVYILKDKVGCILYIGTTTHSSLRSRMSGHFSTKEWMVNVVSCELLYCDTRSEAYQTESLLIKQHQPIFNVVGTSDGGKQQFEHYKRQTGFTWDKFLSKDKDNPADPYPY